MNIQRAARYLYLRFIRLQGDPHSVALGVAIGLFFGVTPLFPVQTLIIIFVAGLLRGNLIAALLSSFAVSNPLTWLPQYYFSWRIGDRLLPGRLSWEQLNHLPQQLASGSGLADSLALLARLGLDSMLVVLAGGVLLAIPFTIAGYLLSFKFFQVIHKKRREKHILK
jgi:uncharacterized protein